MGGRACDGRRRWERGGERQRRALPRAADHRGLRQPPAPAARAAHPDAEPRRGAVPVDRVGERLGQRRSLAERPRDRGAGAQARRCGAAADRRLRVRGHAGWHHGKRARALPGLPQGAARRLGVGLAHLLAARHRCGSRGRPAPVAKGHGCGGPTLLQRRRAHGRRRALVRGEPRSAPRLGRAVRCGTRAVPAPVCQAVHAVHLGPHGEGRGAPQEGVQLALLHRAAKRRVGGSYVVGGRVAGSNGRLSGHVLRGCPLVDLGTRNAVRLRPACDHTQEYSY